MKQETLKTKDSNKKDVEKMAKKVMKVLVGLTTGGLLFLMFRILLSDNVVSCTESRK